MKIKSRKVSALLAGALVLGSISLAFADSARVVTLGANLSPEQRATMLKFFGVNENEVMIIEVNNQDERKYLEGIATEEQLGKKTFSCSFVEPTKAGSGINVKIANLTWLTSSMIASTLSTAGITDANVVVAANFPVSGTGALTGILLGFEDVSGKELDEDKKELASEELIITGNLGEEIGPEKATGVINDIKTEIIKNNTKDTTQIADTINNITNNYNITLSADQQKNIENLMTKISEQDYNYKEMKETLNGIKETINEKLDSMGEGIEKGKLDTIKGWFSSIGDWFKGLFKQDNKDLGIVGNTNDDILGSNVTIDATNENAINTPSSEKEGFFTRIWNWFTGLFKNDESIDSTDNKETVDNEESIDNDINELSESDMQEDNNESDLNINEDLSEDVHIDTSKEDDETENNEISTDENAPNNTDSINESSEQNEYIQ